MQLKLHVLMVPVATPMRVRTASIRRAGGALPASFGGVAIEVGTLSTLLVVVVVVAAMGRQGWRVRCPGCTSTNMRRVRVAGSHARADRRIWAGGPRPSQRASPGAGRTLGHRVATLGVWACDRDAVQLAGAVAAR